jgi:hypothetical protein
MATASPIAITTDESAAQALEQALREQLEQLPGEAIQITGWPTIEIRLTGPHYDGTITAATAKALVEVQHAVDQAYLRLVRPDGKRLTDAEKDKTAITAAVESGSTLLIIDLNPMLTQLASELVSKMTPNEILIAVLGLGMIAGATVVAKQYVKSRAEKAGKAAELATQVALSEQETRRLEIVTQAMTRQPVLAQAREDFDDARDALLRSAADADTVNLDGVHLTGEQARRLPREPRATSEEVQLNGVYLITGVAWQPDDEAVLELRSTERTLELKASLNTRSLLQTDKDFIAAAEWNRTPLYLSINARMLRGEVTKATIVGFDWDALRNTDATAAPG